LKTSLKLYKDYHEEIVRLMKEKKIPFHVVRYEDLLDNPEPTLKEMFAFMLGVESIEGTVAERRVKEIIDAGH
jgi:hypothetical protein